MKIVCIHNKKIILFFIIFIIILLLFLGLFIFLKSNSNASIEDFPKCKEECYDIDNKNYDDFLIEQYKSKKLMALTFDDGPSKYTDFLVYALSERNVPATFFIIGDNVVKYGSSLEKEKNANCEIGIHSFVHKLFTRLKDEEIKEQIDSTKLAILSETDTNIKLIRVPYGSTSKRVEGVISSCNLTSVLWDIDSYDWKFRNTNKVYDYVLKRVKGNQIILMHDTYKTSVDAALRLVDTLKDNCYTFVTVSKLLEIKDIVNNEKTESEAN